MSKEGYDKLVAELNEMIQVELPRVKDAIVCFFIYCRCC